LRCAECGAAAPADALGWGGYRVDDPRDEEAAPEVAFFCLACASREFGGR